MNNTTTTAETPRLNRAYAAAVHRLVGSFHNMDHDALRGVAQAANHELYAIPMWGTCFLVGDGCDRRKIRDLLIGFEPEDAEAADAMVHDYGLSVDKSDYIYDDDPEQPSLDEDSYVEAVIDAWRDGNFDGELLASSGWQRVGDTGVLALDLGGDDLILGIDGAGFSFYGNIDTGDRTGIWCRLYALLGYEWHHSEFRSDVVHAAVRTLCLTEVGSAEEREAITLLRDASKRASQGGPLTADEIAAGESI